MRFKNDAELRVACVAGVFCFVLFFFFGCGFVLAEREEDWSEGKLFTDPAPAFSRFATTKLPATQSKSRAVHNAPKLRDS